MFYLQSWGLTVGGFGVFLGASAHVKCSRGRVHNHTLNTRTLVVFFAHQKIDGVILEDHF